MGKLVAWDIETTIGTAAKRKGTPFGGVNWVVTHAFGSDVEKTPTEYRFGKWPGPAPGWLRPVLEDCAILATFNGKFDLLHALQDHDNLVAWMEYVANGGMIWDCQLAEYLLRGMEQSAHMMSLEEVALHYGGTIKEDAVKALWAAGVNTHEIEPALLSRYLCGDGTMQDLGDVRNTLMIAKKQIAAARKCGQLRSILLNMGALICTVEMERNGMFVDKDRGLAIAEQLAASLVELKEGLNAYLPTDLPFEFNWTNRYHLSPLIFGGRIKYECRQYDLKDGTTTWVPPEDHALLECRADYAYAQKDETHYILEDGSTMECAWYEHLCGTEWMIEGNRKEGQYAVVNKSGKNAGEKKTKKVKCDDYTKPKGRMAPRYVEFKGHTEPKPEWASETPGLYSVSGDVIEELGVRGIPFLTALSKVQALAKDLGTYYIVTDEDGNSKGMLSLVGADWLIHHKLNHTSTVTGRLSSSDPNLTNIPKGNKSEVKTVFVSRYGQFVDGKWNADGVIIQSDFSSLEVYVQAILTMCRQLIADLKAGLDMHVKRLAVKEGISYEECYSLCKGENYSKDWDYKRTGAKVFSFQRAYGAGAPKIAASTGMLLTDVEALIAAEDLEYPEIKEHFEKRTEQIKRARVPGGGSRPHPTVPGVFCNLGKSYIRTPDGQLYSYVESPAPAYLCKRGITASFSPTEIKNYEVQGTGGTWAKAAMYLAVREFYRRKNFDGLALLVNMVHDALYSDSHNKVKVEAAAVLHACMEAASDYMEWYFSWPLPLPVPSDTTWGASMKDEDPVPNVKELAAEIRKDLRSRYMDNYIPSYLH